jgi:hypothetical protein
VRFLLQRDVWARVKCCPVRGEMSRQRISAISVGEGCPDSG